MRWLLLILALAPLPGWAEGPSILSIDLDGKIVYTNPSSFSTVSLDYSTKIDGPWISIQSLSGAPGINTATISELPPGTAFFRLLAEPDLDDFLITHLSFNTDFNNGLVADLSGHDNHGRRYGKPCCPEENWPSPITGPDGSQAAELSWSYDGYGLYGKSGDYIGIPWSEDFMSLNEATISIWAHYYTAMSNQITFDHAATLLSAGKDIPGSWTLGRNYTDYTSFILYTAPFQAIAALRFPDSAPNGNTGGWHLYTVTFSNGLARAYFDGVSVDARWVPVQELNLAGHYLGISGWTFNATPELDMSVDGHPNNAWLNGSIDDLRIYNRALTPENIRNYYLSFDVAPPATPSGVSATATGPIQVKLSWMPSTDNFRVSHYVVHRDGVAIGETHGTAFFDTQLTPNSEYAYSITAVDPSGNASQFSASVTVSTKLAGTGTQIIIDDADGIPWIQQTGSWTKGTDLPGFWGAGFLSDGRRDKGKTLIFRPSIPESGEYNVFVRYPGRTDVAHALEPAAPYDVITPNGTNTVIVNQSSGFGQWHLIGRFHFEQGTNSFVRLRTDTTTQFVVGDAVKFEQ